jgi:hypothetical protein
VASLSSLAASHCRIESEGWESWLDLTLHYICISWKLVLSIIPPAPWLGGYPCFIIAMAMLVGEWWRGWTISAW